MKRHEIRLIVWNAAEAAQKAELIRGLGYRVEYGPFDQAAFRKMRAAPPDAVVIDLGRIPSQGRDVGLGLRSYKDTRRVPIVFIEGDPGKTTKVKDLLPDAHYVSWEKIAPSLEKAIASPPASPVVPRSNLEGYAGAPLPKKLGIKPGSEVILLQAPPGFEKSLGPLPDGAEITRLIAEDLRIKANSARANLPETSPVKKRATKPSPQVPRQAERTALRLSSTADRAPRRPLILWFVRADGELKSSIGRMAAGLGNGGLWIIWPKKASGVASDLTQNAVRAIGLATGLVDYKVCSIDETWSGLLFSRRKATAPR